MKKSHCKKGCGVQSKVASTNTSKYGVFSIPMIPGFPKIMIQIGFSPTTGVRNVMLT
jgi:hypothetical protein